MRPRQPTSRDRPSAFDVARIRAFITREPDMQKDSSEIVSRKFERRHQKNCSAVPRHSFQAERRASGASAAARSRPSSTVYVESMHLVDRSDECRTRKRGRHVKAALTRLGTSASFKIGVGHCRTWGARRGSERRRVASAGPVSTRHGRCSASPVPTDPRGNSTGCSPSGYTNPR